MNVAYFAKKTFLITKIFVVEHRLWLYYVTFKNVPVLPLLLHTLNLHF